MEQSIRLNISLIPESDRIADRFSVVSRKLLEKDVRK